MGFGGIFDEYLGLMHDKNELKQEAADLNDDATFEGISEEEYNKRSRDITDDAVFAYEKGVICQSTAMDIINSVNGDTGKLFDVEPERECNSWDEPDDY